LRGFNRRIRLGAREEERNVIVHERLEGARLAGNLLEDPTERNLFAYLPRGYAESKARYPTAYLLHAYGQTAEQLVFPDTGGQRWSPALEDALDRSSDGWASHR
jgi:hypothetical protein